MIQAFTRTEMLLGAEGLNKLKNSKVVILGIGGVGSYVVEGLARSGVGHLVLCDNDEVCVTNINRQVHATMKTVGDVKAEAMKERVLTINPTCVVDVHPYLYNAASASMIIGDDVDYVVDAIDMVSAKIHLVTYCQEKNIPLMASMGTGNKLNPTMLEVTDIYKTDVCPLAKVMRKELKKRGIRKLKVVYSKELPLTPLTMDAESPKETTGESTEMPSFQRRSTPGSVSFVPSVAGMIIASEVVKDLCGIIKKH